ncbi:MAG: OmpA/MotB domain protein [Enterovirga sp.]|nr:OmpA/MotB domain protein [Enterovirga sp.]
MATRILKAGLLVAVLAFGAAPAQALTLHSVDETRPDYTAEDVARAFAAPKADDLGASRSLCIGTDTECAVPTRTRSAASASPSLDLMVAFTYNSAELTEQARRNLDEFALALQQPALAARRFSLDGFTDSHGDSRYNLKLSERRAAAVREYLVRKGVAPASLAARGFGQAKPRVPDPTDPANRRVEARLSE